MLRLIAICGAFSLLAMILIDRAIGPKAEFLNAWSVVERLLGREPSSGISVVAQHYGTAGEFAAVLLANTIFGGVIALLIKAGCKLFS